MVHSIEMKFFYNTKAKFKKKWSMRLRAIGTFQFNLRFNITFVLSRLRYFYDWDLWIPPVDIWNLKPDKLNFDYTFTYLY